MHHEPVMINEVLTLIENHSRGKKILDGTLGLGGYSEEILEKFPDSFVLGLDRDEQAINFARERLKIFQERFSARHKNFGSLEEIPEAKNFDAYVFDLGVSNMQITLPERGFSFQNDGLLDMRMNKNDNLTAADVIRNFDAKTLAKIFRDYGEERHAEIIARAIKNHKSPIETTSDLVKVIRETLPQPLQRKMGTHPARRIFQALRIFVNDEAGELERLLATLPDITRENEAVIIFVSYHSLEDRKIKHAFRNWQAENFGKILTKHPMTPTEKELEKNYKARSAKLRAFFTIRH